VRHHAIGGPIPIGYLHHQAGLCPAGAAETITPYLDERRIKALDLLQSRHSWKRSASVREQACNEVQPSGGAVRRLMQSR
jgi:hypothetical protein